MSSPNDIELTMDVRLPEKLLPFANTPSRYKAAYGGRGGAKSYAFAQLVVMTVLKDGCRIMCLREVQNSIRESVRQLIVDVIKQNGLEMLFDILEREIRCKINDGLIIFKGLQHYTAASIKSLENFKIAYIEEAQTISQHSWDLLRPTMRAEGSEIWVAWNPRFETDPIDKFFRGPGCPEDAIVVNINHVDNPWFPEVLKREMAEDFKHRPEEAEHIWNGGYVTITEGAYYARQIVDLENEGRLWTGQFDARLPVYTSWDIGVRDKTAVWFWQATMKHVTIVDFYETDGDGIEQIVRQALPELNPNLDEAADACLHLDRRVPFDYGRHYLPHDVGNREWGAGGRSRYEILQGFGVKPIHAGIAIKPASRIAAVRALLPLAKFVPNDRVRFGVKRLMQYRRRFNEVLQTYTDPLHDDASHAADAFGEYALHCPLVSLPVLPEEVYDDPAIEGTSQGRMKVRLDVHAYLRRKEREQRMAE